MTPFPSPFWRVGADDTRCSGRACVLLLLNPLGHHILRLMAMNNSTFRFVRDLFPRQRRQPAERLWMQLWRCPSWPSLKQLVAIAETHFFVIPTTRTSQSQQLLKRAGGSHSSSIMLHSLVLFAFAACLGTVSVLEQPISTSVVLFLVFACGVFPIVWR